MVQILLEHISNGNEKCFLSKILFIITYYFEISVHGFGSTCPHPRVLNNLISVSLAAMFSLFEEKRLILNQVNKLNSTDDSIEEQNWKTKLDCFISIFEEMLVKNIDELS